MNRGVVILGTGGHAKVVVDILEAGGVEIAGFISLEGADSYCGYPVLGDDGALQGIYEKGVQDGIVAIGDNRRRGALIELLQSYGFNLRNAISPNACISRRAEMGSGIAAMPGVVVNAGSHIGDGVILNTNCSVDHDCRIGKHAHVGPGVTLAGGVTMEVGAFLGTGVSVAPNVTVGCWARVGAGAVVVKDLPPDVTAIGIPAKPIPIPRIRR